MVSLVLVVGCGGGSPVTDATAVDVAHEQDVLFECAQHEIRAIGFDVDWADASMRRVQSAWVDLSGDGLARGRLIVEVLVDPYNGPGMTVRSQRQLWQGPADSARPDARVLVGAHDESTPGWRSQPRDDDDIAREREMLSAIRTCWSATRDSTGR